MVFTYLMLWDLSFIFDGVSFLALLLAHLKNFREERTNNGTEDHVSEASEEVKMYEWATIVTECNAVSQRGIGAPIDRS